MLVNARPEFDNVPETLWSLRFAKLVNQYVTGGKARRSQRSTAPAPSLAWSRSTNPPAGRLEQARQPASSPGAAELRRGRSPRGTVRPESLVRTHSLVSFLPLDEATRHLALLPEQADIRTNTIFFLDELSSRPRAAGAIWNFDRLAGAYTAVDATLQLLVDLQDQVGVDGAAAVPALLERSVRLLCNPSSVFSDLPEVVWSRDFALLFQRCLQPGFFDHDADSEL